MDNDMTQPNLPPYQSPFIPNLSPPLTRKGLPVWAIVTISIAGVLVLCCTGIVIFAASPAGRQVIAQGNATSTAQVLAAQNAYATSTAYALAHPKPQPTVTALPTVKSSPSPKPSVSPTSTPSLSPKPSINPTQTPLGNVLNGTTFGGTQAAFDTQYGASPDSIYQQGNMTFSINLTNGTDGQQHIFGMLVYNTDASTWSLNQAETIFPMFNPPDARHLGDASDSNGNFTQIYSSANLKATLPSDQFSPDPPGTFIIDYEQGKGGVPGIFQCSINP